MKNYRILYIVIGITSLWYGYGLFIVYKANTWAIKDPMAVLGQFGDAFGAINTLFSGLAFVALIYTILQQQQSIDSISHESNFRIILSEINSYRNGLDNFEYSNKKGLDAIRLFFNDDGRAFKIDSGDGCFIYYTDANVRLHYDMVLYFELKMSEFYRLINLFDELETTSAYKKFLIKDIQHIYITYFGNCTQLIDIYWNLNIINGDEINPQIRDLQIELRQKIENLFTLSNDRMKNFGK